MGLIFRRKGGKGSEIKRLKRALKPSLWQRFKVALGTARPEEVERVGAYKVIFRGLRNKRIAAGEEKLGTALKFIGSRHVSHEERETLLHHMLSGTAYQHHAHEIISHLKRLSDAGEHGKIQDFLSSRQMIAALKLAGERRRLIPRRTFTLLSSKKQLTRDIMSRGLIQAAQEHRIGLFSPEFAEKVRAKLEAKNRKNEIGELVPAMVRRELAKMQQAQHEQQEAA